MACGFDIWSSIQSQKAAMSAGSAATATAEQTPYVHPLVRRSSSSLSQTSLELCTESLGCETGSNDFSDEVDFFSDGGADEVTDDVKQKEEEDDEIEMVNKEGFLVAVKYPCGISRRSPERSFPPPLMSLSRRDGPCISMRPCRKDGRLVVEAVAVPTLNYLHAERHGGRLQLSFVTAATSPETKQVGEADEELLIEREEIEEEILVETEEEEVEVVERGTVIEVKVSTQPGQQGGGGSAAGKVLRSSIVINKFVGGTPLTADEAEAAMPPSTSGTTAAAAAVVASSLSAELSPEHGGTATAYAESGKLLFTSRSRSKAELLHKMRRCSELRRPIFFWEPCCIATSS